jgi:hypothetical protein
MDEHQVAWNEKVAQTIIKNLEKRRMAGSYAAEAQRAKAEVLEMIPSGSSVFRCGSMTALGMGLWDALEANPEVNVMDPYRPELPPEEAMALRRQGLLGSWSTSTAWATGWRPWHSAPKRLFWWWA